MSIMPPRPPRSIVAVATVTAGFLAAVLPLARPRAASAALAPGDVLILGFNAADPDDFSFMVLTAVPAAERIRFTDNGVYNGALRATEGTLEYAPPPGGLRAGTVVVVTNAGTAACGADSGTIIRMEGGAYNFSSAGDQIVVYQAIDGATSFVAAVSTDGTDWKNADDPHACALPPGLVDGRQALHTARHFDFGADIDNAAYTNYRAASPAELKAAVRTAGFWMWTNDAAVAFPLDSADARLLAAPAVLAFQGFEGSAADNWTVTAGAGRIAAATGATDDPPNQRIRSGTLSYQCADAVETLELATVPTRGWRSLALTVHVSATGASTSKGMEENDYIELYVARNGEAFGAAPDLRVTGFGGAGNCRWSYSEIAAETQAGLPVCVAPAGTQRRDAPGDGWSKLRVRLPRGTDSVRLKLVTRSNADELWNVDDITLSGKPPVRGAVFTCR